MMHYDICISISHCLTLTAAGPKPWQIGQLLIPSGDRCPLAIALMIRVAWLSVQSLSGAECLALSEVMIPVKQQSDYISSPLPIQARGTVPRQARQAEDFMLCS